MEFGRVEENELDSVDFTLPPEPDFNKKILDDKSFKSPKVYIGCAKWGREEWVGKIYPHGTKEKNFLDHYIQHYNSIELNATHYKIYGAAGIKKWADKVNGKDFCSAQKCTRGLHTAEASKEKILLHQNFSEALLRLKNISVLFSFR
jgi:uncharacterized protein YecE (DUF72 family)